MNATVKPGTRCECGNATHAAPKASDWHFVYGCNAPAVRLVTVVGRGKFIPIPGYESANFKHVPMCQACFEYHEANRA